MNGNWKKELESIPLPSDLHSRSLLGIERAQAESVQRRRTRLAKPRPWVGALCILLLLFVGTAMLQPQVRAAIQKALQFVPGVGIVKTEEKPLKRLILKNSVTTQIGEGKITLSGVQIDDKMTFLILSGNQPSQRADQLELVDSSGVEFQIQRSTSTWSTAEWSASYWYNGKLDIHAGPAKIVLGESDKYEIPFTLVQAETVGSYEELGETVSMNGITITAVASREGENGRLSLLSQHPDDMRVADYGWYGIHNGKKLSVTDETGQPMQMKLIPGLFSPARDFHFRLGADANAAEKVYTLTIPEINMEVDDTVTIQVPTHSVDNLNIPFNLAGFPVTITRTERLTDKGPGLRLYLDLHFDPQASKSLHNFRIDARSHMARMNDQTGAIEYIEFSLENPDAKQMKLKLTNPQILVRGPWIFQLPATRYFQQR
ncbi:hypothetical protein [Paenibacillus koleovorans]|uniref:hypothetical protein n=1 Tax=Paenibacillus koleovorans TaxID=121608 RepID=UPI000FDAE2D3|nr:hypothetical protein [Paenibacillus koleovorans]